MQGSYVTRLTRSELDAAQPQDPSLYKTLGTWRMMIYEDSVYLRAPDNGEMGPLRLRVEGDRFLLGYDPEGCGLRPGTGLKEGDGEGEYRIRSRAGSSTTPSARA